MHRRPLPGSRAIIYRPRALGRLVWRRNGVRLWPRPVELPLNESVPRVSFFSRIFGKARAGREPIRPLWHRVVEIARERQWYADCGVEDSVAGRFDAITLVLSLVLLRMEREDSLRLPLARLTELFVEDMDGQLRQSGVGDLVVGKHIGRLVSTLGGRLGALREALSHGDGAQGDGAQGDGALVPVLERNVTLLPGADTARLAGETRRLAGELDAMSADDLLAARFSR